ITADAGATFGLPVAFNPPAGFNSLSGDTDLKFNGQGRLFWSNLAGPRAHVRVCVSQIDPVTGNSITSTGVSDTSEPRIMDDKPFMAIDTKPDSPFFDNIYVVWSRFANSSIFDEVYFSRSTDQGITWSSPIQLSNGPVEGFVWPSDISV